MLEAQGRGSGVPADRRRALLQRLPRRAPSAMWDRHLYGERGAMISGARIRPELFRYMLEADLAEKQADRARPVEFFERMAGALRPVDRGAARARAADRRAVGDGAARAIACASVARDRAAARRRRRRLSLAAHRHGVRVRHAHGTARRPRRRTRRSPRATARRRLRAATSRAGADELESAVAYLRHMLAEPPRPRRAAACVRAIEKGLSWTTRLLDLTKLEQKAPEYLKLNPNGVVPTLVHGDRVVYESNIFAKILDDVFPSPRLYPPTGGRGRRPRCGRRSSWRWRRSTAPLMYLRVIGPYTACGRATRCSPTPAARPTTRAPRLGGARLRRHGRRGGEAAAPRHPPPATARPHRPRTRRAQPPGGGPRHDRGPVGAAQGRHVPARAGAARSARHPNVLRWLDVMGRRPSIVQSEYVRPTCAA